MEQTIQPITDLEFEALRALVNRETGIHLGPNKRALVVARLASRLKTLGLSSFGEYYRQVLQDANGERRRMVDRICTNETHFFREPQHFEILERRLIPEWAEEADAGRRLRLIRVLSAGCSTGMEAYSVAMTLLAHLPRSSEWSIEIIGVDVSERALATARGGVWPVSIAAEIPGEHLRRFMLRGTGSQAGNMKADPALQRIVSFQRLSLTAETWPLRGPFDAIFCRNVLIYFDAASKKRTVERLLQLLGPRGYFFVGHSESLHALSDRAVCVAPTVYRVQELWSRRVRGLQPVAAPLAATTNPVPLSASLRIAGVR